MRQPDLSLPPEELLFRSARPAALVMDGDRVLPEAVQLPSSSCNRERYALPESVLVAERPADTCVVQIAAGDLPAPMTSLAGVTYDWLAADDPLPANEAHAEIRLCRSGMYNRNHRPNAAMAERLQVALAERFRVLLRGR